MAEPPSTGAPRARGDSWQLPPATLEQGTDAWSAHPWLEWDRSPRSHCRALGPFPALLEEMEQSWRGLGETQLGEATLNWD